MLLGDPLGALIEKEVRFLSRSPRFRLVFLMGFTFGLLIWLPVALGRQGVSQSFLSGNYLTVVSVYSLLLLERGVLLEFLRLRPLRRADSIFWRRCRSHA